jgi:putative ABC transport system permease protein
MKIPLQKGRYFTEQDNAQSAPVAIIDETLANQYWPGEDPIGRHLTFEGGKTNPIWREIVGVVGRVKYKGAEGDIKGQLYYPYQQNSLPSMFLAIQASNDPAGLISSAREAIRAVDKDLPIFRVKTMEQLVDDSLAQRRFSMSLLMIFAVLALCLAAVGHYGVLSYSVTQRSHEIGIRMAMGAQPRDIFKLVVGQGLSLTAIGIIVGAASALGFTRVVSSLLFAVSTTDPGIYTAMSVLLIAVGVLACFIPARRAMRVDPIVALRYE